MMNGRVAGKVVMVTGAASGLGRAQAERFAAEGARLVITDITPAALKGLSTELQHQGTELFSMIHNVTEEAAWAEVMEATLDRFGRLDVLINNAGVSLAKSVETTSLAEWRALMAVNLDGVFLGTRVAIESMKPYGGSIINVSSIEGIIADPLAAAYNASKGGVRIFTKSAALHCAEQGYGIRVNSIHPGYVDTPLVSDALATLPADEAEAVTKRILEAIPFGRMGLPQEIANGVLFLASDESSYMTGSELVMDGGYTAK